MLKRSHTQRLCRLAPREVPLQCDIPKIKENFKYVNHSDLIYCAIEKTGSTFWKRIMHIIGGWANVSNPMQILSKHADTKRGGFKTLAGKSMNEIERMFVNATSIMFVRDPYTRLFSGWLDKFYSTNPFYWNYLGRSIVTKERKNATNISKICGHDVTFPEFVRYIINTLQTKGCLDMHFAPGYKHCLPCSLDYKFIGKYETLKEDTLYLINNLNLKIEFTDFESDAQLDAIRDTASWVFEQKPRITSCMPFRCGLFRAWKRLQSRGVLSKHAEFPFQTNKQADNISVSDFQKLLLTEYSKSDPSETKQNRLEVLAEAFQSLKIVDLNRMIKSFYQDFHLFDYDTKPDFLYSEYPRNFSYLKECPYDFKDP